MSYPAVSAFTGDPQEWDDFVRAQRGWTHFHLYGWRRVLEDTFGHECVYLTARTAASRDIAALVPLVRVRSALFGHYLVSMPFVNYGGPLGTDEGVRAILDHVVRAARSRGVKLLELRSAIRLPFDLPVTHRKITVLLDLASDAQATWTQLPAKLRSQIRKPEKEGVTVRFGEQELDAFYSVFAHHMRDLGTPVQSRRLFENIVANFPDDVRIAAAYHRGQPVAAGWAFQWGGEFEMTWASALRSHKAIAPNMLLYWRVIEHAISGGATVFNFGRCTPGSGTHRFKQQWGGRDEPLWWYQWSRTGRTGATPNQDHGFYRLAARAWQHLPLKVATWLGPRIVRSIP